MVTSDYQRLKRVFLNLLTNSCKFTNEGKICVYIDENSYDDTILIQISDTGTGISENKQKNLFKAFNSYRDDTGTMNKNGLGLG